MPNNRTNRIINNNSNNSNNNSISNININNINNHKINRNTNNNTNTNNNINNNNNNNIDSLSPVSSNSNLKKELKNKTNQLIKAKKTIAELNEILDSCQDRLENNIHEKSKLEDKVQEFEVMKLNLQMKNIENLEQEFFKSQHRVDISKKLLFEASMEIAILKRIINDFENMSTIDFIKNKKPNSLIYYNKNYNQKNYK